MHAEAASRVVKNTEADAEESEEVEENTAQAVTPAEVPAEAPVEIPSETPAEVPSETPVEVPAHKRGRRNRNRKGGSSTVKVSAPGEEGGTK